MVPPPLQGNLETAAEDSTILSKTVRSLHQLLLAVKSTRKCIFVAVAASSSNADASSGFLFWYITPMQSCMA